MSAKYFRRYDHVTRLGHYEVGGLTMGLCHIFPKIDGTNASVWWNPDTHEVECGSRNRKIAVGCDNHGFAAYVENNKDKFLDVFEDHSHWIIYGEWLVPHTLKTYRDEAWRNLWVFDVWDRATMMYVHYDEYSSILKCAGVDIITPKCTMLNPTDDGLQRELMTNTFLIKDGKGLGEGIVIKNYAWRNDNGNQPWGKIVRNEFTEKNKDEFGVTHKDPKFKIEPWIAQEYVTKSFVEKTRAKVRYNIAAEMGVIPPKKKPEFTESEQDTWTAAFTSIEATYRKQMIPRLLQTCYHDLVAEELWQILKDKKNPTIDFKALNRWVTYWTKKHAGDLF